jgi:hypothetical protein
MCGAPVGLQERFTAMRLGRMILCVVTQFPRCQAGNVWLLLDSARPGPIPLGHDEVAGLAGAIYVLQSVLHVDVARRCSLAFCDQEWAVCIAMQLQHPTHNNSMFGAQEECAGQDMWSPFLATFKMCAACHAYEGSLPQEVPRFRVEGFVSIWSAHRATST